MIKYLNKNNNLGLNCKRMKMRCLENIYFQLRKATQTIFCNKLNFSANVCVNGKLTKKSQKKVTFQIQKAK